MMGSSITLAVITAVYFSVMEMLAKNIPMVSGVFRIIMED